MPHDTAASGPAARTPRRQWTRRGRGRAFASFGEIVQGRRASGEDFLVTLPVDLWTHCRLRARPHGAGPSVVSCEMSKSRAAAEAVLTASGHGDGWCVELDFERNIPIGKGLSSSTADMLAATRALEAAFGVRLAAGAISELFAGVEPHDGLHFDGCVVYDHRRGRLLRALDYIPSFIIIGVDAGGERSTLDYNTRLSFTDGELGEYDALLADCVDAFARFDDRAIARCAERSARLHLRRTGSDFLAAALALVDEVGAWGALATHSGTCVGLLFPTGVDPAVLADAERAAVRLGAIIRTRTLAPLIRAGENTP